MYEKFAQSINTKADSKLPFKDSEYSLFSFKVVTLIGSGDTSLLLLTTKQINTSNKAW
jgi:hypothetical protein